MCFDVTAKPPAIPAELLKNPSRTWTEELILDGAQATFQAFIAQADAPSGPAVVVLPDIRGLFEYYKRLAVAFAEAGHHAIAIDYFGRTAGTGDRSDDFDQMAHIKQTTPEDIRADAAVALAHLRSRTGTDEVVTVGFCFGGSQSYLATTDSSLRLAGAIAFYGGLDATRLGVYPDPASKAPEMTGPILALYGGATRPSRRNWCRISIAR